MTRITTHKVSLVLLWCAMTLVFGSCAALQPPSATGPRGAEQLYPVLLPEDIKAKDATLAALNRLSQSANSNALEPQLQPVTATVLSLPATANTPVYLPKVGAAAVMNEEETRESLRRFIREWEQLIGADPAKLSLVERSDQPDGTKLAVYEQRAFRYPIRGGYGKLQIHFTADRRVVDLNSSCIPNAERIQTTLSALTVSLKAEDAVKQLRENEISYTDSTGKRINLRAPASAEITPRELVTYIRPARDRVDALEFRIAWEIQISGLSPSLIYVDAVNGEILGAG